MWSPEANLVGFFLVGGWTNPFDISQIGAFLQVGMKKIFELAPPRNYHATILGGLDDIFWAF